MNAWDEEESRKRQREKEETNLYRNRSRMHGDGLTEEEQEEKDFRRSFPRFHKVQQHANGGRRLRASSTLMLAAGYTLAAR